MANMIDKFFAAYDEVFDAVFMSIFGISPESNGGFAIMTIIAISYIALLTYCQSQIKARKEELAEEKNIK